MNHVEILRTPDVVLVQPEQKWQQMTGGADSWNSQDICVTIRESPEDMRVLVCANTTAVRRVALRWKVEIGRNTRILGDHWERGYGDFCWLPIQPDRVLPWYFLSTDGVETNGYGVKTAPSALCCWLVDDHCVTLLLDLRCGGDGVELRGRTLNAASIISYQAQAKQNAFEAAQAFCKKMCVNPRLPEFPVYGGNNWYYAYGKSCDKQIREDSRLMSSLSDTENRPFMLIDDGWQNHWGSFAQSKHPMWQPDPVKFPDMQRLAKDMTEIGVRPGLWFRPLLATAEIPKNLLLQRINRDGDLILDPSWPEVLEIVSQHVKRYVGWGYTLLKHDFTTYDICGRWGNRFGFMITDDGWHFADRTKTTAEIVLSLYRTLAAAAGNAMLMGCNTFSHLSAGLFALQRTGDDTSGLQWERTRRMGINTLAFRMPQHNTFYSVDGDCVGLTDKVDWNLNHQWLDLLAHSGTPLFVSADPKVITPEQQQAVRHAFALAAESMSPAIPLDWMDTTSPCKWLAGRQVLEYNWSQYDKIEQCSGYFNWN